MHGLWQQPKERAYKFENKRPGKEAGWSENPKDGRGDELDGRHEPKRNKDMKPQGKKADVCHGWILNPWENHSYQDIAEAKSKESLMPCEDPGQWY